ncbi:hypothetical protein [Streptomyces sp. NPDC023327]|uniref:hypothetical protein n=1 Tax=Streptomyces sp. NPDC023327 TaxID=3157088 RepID=UPI0034052590
MVTEAKTSAAAAQSSNRAGARIGRISELTVIVPLKPGGADTLRARLAATKGLFKGADRVGTLHFMRFVLLNNDTQMLFATAYDGDWDTYINDFATKIPNEMDGLFSVVEGWPGIKSPQVKDFIVKHQITATAWYSAYPDLTVAKIRRSARVASALDNLLKATG